MKEHFCPAEQSTITYQGECSWCGEQEALAQPEQEPVCPDCKAEVLYECVACSSNNYPPQRTWVGLTKKEILLANEKQDESIIAAPDDELIQFAKAIEAKLKEKNT